MRWLYLLCTLLLGSSLLCAAELENANAAGPDTAPVFAEHTPFAATIQIRNPHDRAVRIERLDATCSCMHLDVADHFILPHQTTAMQINVDNANRSGPQRMGVSVYLTDPDLEAIDVQVWWKVTPDIAVDAIAPRAEITTARPTDIAWRDIYKFVANERPDELARLSKRMRLESSLPDFAVTGIDYAGAVWAFAPVKQSDGSWLITASAKDPAVELPEKLYDETVTVHTNHPQKSKIQMQFVANITRKAGRKAFDPFEDPPPPPLMPPTDKELPPTAK